ncbi:MAG: HisA/HisF-related TIM barrel protein, partial [Actinomycetes bacterium]
MTDFNQSPKLQLLPAIDVAGGKAVRLTQGKAGTETSFGSPVDAAEDWVRQGAEWIHLVDLDAAFGRGDNRAVIKKVIKASKGRVQVELSGGIRDEASLESALATGVKRINLGT